jgi:hypothetical protein
MPATKPKILLSEASSVSARETITALGLAGYCVEVMSSDFLCLGRFSRFVSRVHRAPASGIDPDGYLAAVLDVVKSRRIDVLLPVHEQEVSVLRSAEEASGWPRHRARRFQRFRAGAEQGEPRGFA